MIRPPGLIYAANETPPPAVLIISALQHVAVMAITILYPLILAHEAGLTATDLVDFVSLSMLALGVSTVLLCANSRYVGCGYLCPGGFTQIYLGPSLFALHYGGLAVVFGMTAVAGVLQLAIAPLLRRVRALLPPEIAGLVIAIVGLSLASLGVRYILGNTASNGFQPVNFTIAGITLATMIVLNVWTKGYSKMFCVLIGIALGYSVSAAFGILNLSEVLPKEGLKIFRIPGLAHLSWQFDVTLLAPFAVVAIATTLRAVGDVSNAQRLNDNDWLRPSFRSLAGGVAGNGLASLFCGLVGTTGINTFSSSVGLSGAMGVTSRRIGYVIGLIFAALSLVPATAVVFAAMPAPVMGASMFFTSAFVFISGLQMITTRLLDSRKTIVIGFSFTIAMMADIYHDIFSTVPLVLQPIFSSSLVLGTVCAVLLNIIMRIGVRQRVSLELEAGLINREAIEAFLSEQGARWAARRDVVNRAIFSVVQLLEVLGNPPGGVTIEASFDEFNLDIRISYAGIPLVIPEKKPTTREIIAGEDGERLLAGYLLRRTADRISSRGLDGCAEIALHFEH
jgi:NCS2 family nucleobase:cation symporter-2